ncbi:MAG: hypothetical protein HYY34_01845 [Chloroflexi bacterium]|nr:hypothetical protein [Chloroflexota bacterium]
MPVGTLQERIETLRTALAGVTALLGDPPEGGAGGSGLAGAAGLLADTPAARVGGFTVQFEGQIARVFAYDPAPAVARLTDVFSTLQSGPAALVPTEVLSAFGDRLARVDTLLSADVVDRLQGALASVQGLAEGVPRDPTALASSLLDQIVHVLASLEGPEAERIRAWVQTTQELHRRVMPLIEEARNQPDPAAFALQVVQRRLDGVLDVFGFREVSRIVDAIQEAPGRLLPPETIGAFSSKLAPLASAYSQAEAQAGAAFPQFRDQVVAAGEAMQSFKNDLRPVLRSLRRIVNAPVFQPGALEAMLREAIDRALAVNVQDVQKIDDPFQELFDRIDEAIEAIDLSFVRTEVLGFFEGLREKIDGVDIPSIGDAIGGQVAILEGVVRDLQQGINDLLAQVQAFFDGLRDRYRELAGSIGTFEPDGSFRFHVEQDLRRTLAAARLAIAGDPDDPAAPSVAGALEDVRTAIDGFLGQLRDMLDPVEAAVDQAVTDAVAGVEEFNSFLEGLDIPTLMEDLRKKVQEVLDALIPIDFDFVVDPVVAEIEENTAKLRDIDADSLNDLLRQALAAALDVILAIDFTATISTPLKEQFQAVKDVPRRAIDELQRRYEEALALLKELSPEQLLNALLAAFDAINDAVGALNVAGLLEPLDAAYDRYLVRPLDGLKPSTLLQPVSEAFREATASIGDVSGAEIIAPLTRGLDAIKDRVKALDVTGWADDLLAELQRLKDRLAQIRPSEVLEPLAEEFARLEAELDRFKPSIVFQPVVELAAPLLSALENVQQAVVAALNEAFQAPLRLLDQLNPEALIRLVHDQIDAVLAPLKAADVPSRYTQLKGAYYDLRVATEAGGDERKLGVAVLIDPEDQLGDMVETYKELIAALEGLKSNIQLSTLTGPYEQVRERLLDMLPPYARQLLDVETFKRVMRLADPTRFLQELDERFGAIKQKLIPIRPQDIGAELDATYDAVLAKVDALDIDEALERIKAAVEGVKEIVTVLRVDFLAADIDAAVEDVRAVVNALDPARLFQELDAIHAEVVSVVEGMRPSEVLAGLTAILERVQGILDSISLRERLRQPLLDAWQAVEDALAEVDFRVVLSPVVDKLDELEASFLDGLRRTETAFDQMLGTARNALAGGSPVSAGVTV